MASTSTSSRLSPIKFDSGDYEASQTNAEGAGDIPEILSGATLASGEIFQGPQGRETILTPVIIDFRRVIQSKSSTPVIAGIPNRELLHAVIGLYDVSLSEMTPDVLYTSVCDKQAKTIVLVRDIKDATEEIEKKAPTEEGNEDVDGMLKELEKDLEACEDKYEPEPGAPATFFEVFSDTDNDDIMESDDSDDEFSKGLHTFIDKVKMRRRARPVKRLRKQVIGAENRIVAAITFEKTYLKSGEKVVHLTLVAVRKRFRKMCIGKYLINQIKDVSVVGSYDAVVVHADNAAVQFFDRYGFSGDIVLNSRWSELAEQYTNCTLMSYLPPFTGQTILSNSVPELDIIAMEKELKKWRDKSISAYCAELSCMQRVRNEIIHLRALVASQQQLIANLATENQVLRQEKYTVQKDFLEYRLLTSKEQLNTEDDDDTTVDELIKKLELEANLSKSVEGKRKFLLSATSQTGEPYDHGKDTEEFYKVSKNFYEAMREDPNITMAYVVKMVTKAILPASVEEAISHTLQELRDPHMVTRLYFCGSLERPHRIPNILSNGFIDEDFSQGEFGRGLYFSKFPSKAAQFSALGKLLIAEVGIGKTETVIKKDPTRKQPSADYDSIITPGRVTPIGDNEALACQEYVVFNPHLVRPLYLIEYSPHSN